MRKLLLAFACILCSVITKAQLGIHAGADLYKSKITSDNVSINYNYKAGFTGGVFYAIPFAKDFSIVPGVDFVQKGGTINIRMFSGGVVVTQFKSDVRLNYIQVPVNVMYSFKGFSIAAGPTIGVGISGKEKDTQMADSTVLKTVNDIHFGNGEDDDLKRFEIGANIILGYKLKNGLFINASYNPGMNNLAPKGQDESKFRNSGFALQVGFMLPSGNKN